MSENEDPSVPIPYRGTEEYRTELEGRALQEGIDVQRLLDRAARAYLDGEPRPEQKLKPGDAEVLKAVRRVLDESTELAQMLAILLRIQLPELRRLLGDGGPDSRVSNDPTNT